MEEFKHHFSHPHPLKLIVYKQTLNNLSSPLCSACKLKPSGMLYSCIICHDYFLHKTCFERSSTPTPPRVLNTGQNSTEKAVEAIHQMIINNSKAISQAIVSANESGDNTGFNLLIQLISASNNNTGSSSGGGSSGGGSSGGGGGSLPEKITHPFDKKHDLTLLSEPAYGEAHFRCDACRERHYKEKCV